MSTILESRDLNFDNLNSKGCSTGRPGGKWWWDGMLSGAIGGGRLAVVVGRVLTHCRSQIQLGRILLITITSKNKINKNYLMCESSSAMSRMFRSKFVFRTTKPKLTKI